LSNATTYLGTGRRKQSTARVKLTPGTGKITINGKPADAYLLRETLIMIINQPFVATQTSGKFDVDVTAAGGGTAGQAGAIRHGISRALLKVDITLRAVLKKGGFLTRDPRAKERKKYGQKGARRKFQWTKR